MLIWTGTATVTNGDATVVVDTGAALTAEVVAYGAMVVLDGVVYFADSLTDTTTLEMTRVYAGSTGTVDMEIWPVSQDTTNLVNLAQIVARTQAQINILDKNSQGLFFYMKGVTGAADPGPGFIAFDDDDATLVTEAYIDVLDANGRAVSELVALWEAGTTIVIRSLSTTAYRAYTVATNTAESGYADLALTYVGHDGVLADNEALSISWSRAAAGLEINASGNFADRDLYDDEPAGFVFLSADGDGSSITVATLFRKNSGTTADWGPAVPFQGPDGDRGWSPVFAVVTDGERRVLRLVDYVGGEGTEPTDGINQYVSSGGLTGTIGSATDIRGPQGAAGADGTNGTDGADGADGADGTDPGALYNWDDGITDADPGAGNMRADNADLSAAGFLYVSKEGRTGDDLETFLASIGASTNPVKGHITLTSSGGNAQAIVGVSSLTDATNYVKVGLVASSHSGATGFVDATPVSLQFSRAGDQGSSDAVSIASSVNAAPEVTDPGDVTFAITDPDNGDVLSRMTLATLSEAIQPPSGVVEHKTANYTVTVADRDKGFTVDASAATRTISIDPIANFANGDQFTIKKADSSLNNVVIDPSGAETIDGATTLTLRRQGQGVTIKSNGTGWVVVEDTKPGFSAEEITTGIDLLINGMGQINQRAYTTVADDTYWCDRHYILTQTAAITPTLLTDVANGLPSMMRLTQSQASAQRIGQAQIVESVLSKANRGRKITLAGRLRYTAAQAVRYAVLEWTGTTDVVTSDVVNSWTSGSYSAGNFFLASNITVAGVGAITPAASTLTDFKLSVTVSSSCNNLVVLIWTENTAAQSEALDVAWNLLPGDWSDFSWPFVRPRHPGMEVSLCQRYFNRRPGNSFLNGFVRSTHTAVGGFNWQYPVRMRSAASVGYGSVTNGTHGSVTENTADGALLIATGTNSNNCFYTDLTAEAEL